MIFLCPMESGRIVLEQGIFISTEMGQALARELAEGKIKLNRPLVPVHLPYDGLLTMNFGDHDHLKISREEWISKGLPPQYAGEDLSGKSLVIFPMHGLGDQLYLAVALRALGESCPGMKVVVVKPSIASAEQWYPLIYFDSFFETTGPVVKPEEMRQYDFYLNAEHFAHVGDYNGTYPPEFYIRYFFYHEVETIRNPLPKILSVSRMENGNGENVESSIQSLKSKGKPLVFVSSVSTGRVRDLPLEALMEFVHLASERFSLIISTYRRPDIEKAVQNMNQPDVQSTEGLIKGVVDLCQIMASVDYVLTTDSGITHLAEALSRPCGTVFNVVTADERTKHYKFSETLTVEFSIENVCQTPCYVHYLKDGDLCPGMAHVNNMENEHLFYDYPPCLARLEGEHLLLLLDALVEKFPGSPEAGNR